MQYVGAGYYLPALIVGWGIVGTCMLVVPIPMVMCSSGITCVVMGLTKSYG